MPAEVWSIIVITVVKCSPRIVHPWVEPSRGACNLQHGMRLWEQTPEIQEVAQKFPKAQNALAKLHTETESFSRESSRATENIKAQGMRRVQTEKTRNFHPHGHPFREEGQRKVDRSYDTARQDRFIFPERDNRACKATVLLGDRKRRSKCREERLSERKQQGSTLGAATEIIPK